MPTTPRTKRVGTDPATMSPSGFSDDELAVDGFTWGQINEMAKDSVAAARCVYCQAEQEVEPHARKYHCCECGGAETVTSPLVKLGLV